MICKLYKTKAESEEEQQVVGLVILNNKIFENTFSSLQATPPDSIPSLGGARI